MSISLGIRKSAKEILPEPWICLHDEVMDYLLQLTEYPALQALGRLDPYRDTEIDVPDCLTMRKQLEKLACETKAKQLPEPPATVGMEIDPERFGWEGLGLFIEKLLSVINAATKRDRKLLGISD